MGKDDDKLVADELFRMNGQLNEMLNLGHATETKVEVLSVHVQGHSQVIEKLDKRFEKFDEEVSEKFDTLSAKVSVMPERWRGEIKDAVGACQKQRDEVTQAVKQAKASTRNKLSTLTPAAVTPFVPEQENWFKEFWRAAGKPIVMMIIVVGMAVGAGIAVNYCSEGVENAPRAKVEKTLETGHARDGAKDSTENAWSEMLLGPEREVTEVSGVQP